MNCFSHHPAGNSSMCNNAMHIFCDRLFLRRRGISILAKLYKFFDWIITLAILTIGIFHLTFALVPPEYLKKIMGGNITIAVMCGTVTLLNFFSYISPLGLLYTWGFIKKKRSVTFWLKTAGITMAVISWLLLNMATGPLYYHGFIDR